MACGVTEGPCWAASAEEYLTFSCFSTMLKMTVRVPPKNTVNASDKDNIKHIIVALNDDESGSGVSAKLT